MDVPDWNDETEISREGGLPAKFSYAEEFAKRQHRGPWVYAVGLGLFLLTIAPVILAYVNHGAPAILWFVPASAGLIILRLFLSWTKGSPHCPCCKKNIKVCVVRHCYGCGEDLENGRCERCGVDLTIGSAFRSSGDTSGNKQPITYCPGCGVWLKSNFHRRRKASLP
ncbi:hypothetical protein Cflav_PD3288 [Pedosphaera parvula Ellin514]|uniref:Uncharacterized protein n=1 Tax=Pedosphaera parvula (strain Ellin514) TaxID=320771 RepID=B9XJ02_PEDPL|nr:hypothetical protein Cflav_PD3288 [Pedosphaera parvula Ellin514]